MSYDFMKEIRAQWARWVEEENKCPHCGGILPWMQSPLANNQSAQHSVQRTGGESGQQSLFSAGEVLPAKVTAKSTRR